MGMFGIAKFQANAKVHISVIGIALLVDPTNKVLSKITSYCDKLDCFWKKGNNVCYFKTV
jgi:hypothetical protein